MWNNFAINDIAASYRLRAYIAFSAFVKLQLDHSKTKLSFLWEPITVFFVATVLSIVWSEILDVGDHLHYFFYILIGFTVWSLLFAKIVNRGVASLSARSHELSISIKPISSLCVEDVVYGFLNFFTALPFVLIPSFFFFGVSFFQVGFLCFSLVLIAITGISLSLTLGVVAFFFRDVLQVVKAVMRLGFLITPIIWKPERLGEYEYLVWYNPFYSYMHIVRSCLIGDEIEAVAVYIAVCLTVVLALLAFITLSCFGKNIRRGVFEN